MTLHSHSWAYIWEKKKKHDPKGYMHPNVHCSTLTTAMAWTLPKYSSTEEWIKKMWDIYMMEYHSAIEKNEITQSAVTWIDLVSY